MKRLVRTLRPVALIGIGLLLATASAAISQPVIIGGGASAATVVPTPTPLVASEVGSTDWITLVSVLIVLIVVVPIIIRRKSWSS